MKYLKSYEIRDLWLKFWKSKGHDIIDSSPLIPHNDPSLLWINAGVAPLKKYFDGREVPKNKRLANVQKCIRTNDIENVGKTARHHTFFEMLGNFSIGDYFRNDALKYAIEILTSPEYFGIDINKLYFTVYPTDQKTIDEWIKLGVNPNHIFKLENNFWEIGEGPCGPNTEIFFDRGEKYDPENMGTKLIEEDIDNERYIEIWNIVFSQFNAEAGKKRNEYKELPSKNIDTGMGLERVACISQNVETNYETDLFIPIIEKCSEYVNVKYEGQMAFKVISDHLRSVVFALSDGASFSNEGRGYVLRRLLRRATRFARELGMNEPFLYKLVDVVVDNMSMFYTNLKTRKSIIAQQIKIEEERFLATLESGERRLLDFLKKSSEKEVPKEIAFLLYDTFGFPFELTKEIAGEHNFTVDEKGFRKLLEEQKSRARAARSSDDSMTTQNESMMKFTNESTFVGYEKLSINSKVIGIFKDGESVESGSGKVLVVFKETPFYGESGGQIGDQGEISFNGRNYKVTNTIKLPNGQHGHIIDLNEDTISLNEQVLLTVDKEYRSDVAKNHSATHLLNESLRQVLGSHVVQQGSQVYDDGLRFDFNHYFMPTNEEIIKIESLVNREINNAHNVNVSYMTLDEAKALGVQALFGEKYGDIVRVVNMDFAKELCGGTHVENTKDINKFAILSIETKGSGIYRIEATTDEYIMPLLNAKLGNINREINENKEKINKLLEIAKTNDIRVEAPHYTISEPQESYQMVLNRHQELETIRGLAKELEKEINNKLLEKKTLPLDDFLQKTILINGKNVLVFKLENENLDLVKDLVDRLADTLKKSVIFVASQYENKVVFICKNRIENLNAGSLVKQAAIITSGNGGGRNDFAQAGGKDISKVDEALTSILETLKKEL
ncbi:MAG TPA: alanine--tRNA ligase [Acholeplasmataceae bacterium]|nr:alanine--tRNA ligase [Acholeplasmataceae bacterium]